MRIIFLILLSIISKSALGCACCGVDGTWEEYKVKYPAYPTEILKELIIESGMFDDNMRAEFNVSIDQVDLKGKVYTFKTELGDILFKFDESMLIRSSDITFITTKEYKYSNEASIYREFILSGDLSFPKKVLIKTKLKGLASSNKAKMILQGIGNSCPDKNDFKKWIIKIEGVIIGGQGNVK